MTQTDTAAERSAHVTRGRHHAEQTCCNRGNLQNRRLSL